MPTQPRKRRRLNYINFFVGAVQAGFGPFLAVFLIEEGWTQTQVGLGLSASSLALIAGQLPAGILVDQCHRKNLVAAIAMLGIAASALVIAIFPVTTPVLLAEVLHAFASAVLGPAMAALTLQMNGPMKIAEDYGQNARYASYGAAMAIVGFGLLGFYGSENSVDRALLLLTAAMAVPPLLFMLRFREADRAPVGDPETTHAAMLNPRERRRRLGSAWAILFVYGPFLFVFPACVTLFSLGNGAMIPLVAGRLAYQGGASAGILLAAAVGVQQIVAGVLSPWVGKVAEHWGRRPLLVLGFCAQPLRGLLLVATPSLYLLIPAQVLDGVSSAVLLVVVPLIAADLTERTGLLNFALGASYMGMGLGASLSTAITGSVVDNSGYGIAFLGLAAAGIAATLLLLAVMPETTRFAVRGRRVHKP